MTERADFKDSLRQLAKEVLPDIVKPAAPIATVQQDSAPAAKSVDAPKSNPRSKPTGREPKNSRQQISSEPNVITVTTRFPKEIDTLITKASFAQRMNELEPGTKQDILVEAARDWLRRNGYLGKEKSDAQKVSDEVESLMV
ncbi:MAG TPA: hypothetical protein VFE46_02075 [Pirellulales bacterium]|jgi:hypothetical protein|nr:hypothetical protein [Pirellulales bacterium]